MRTLLSRLFSNPTENRLREFIDLATELGLRDEDRNNALHLLDHNESGEAFDLVAAQLYEYNVQIDRTFLEIAYEIGDAMKIDRRDYGFLEKLVTLG